jgi:hypothetical protein
MGVFSTTVGKQETSTLHLYDFDDLHDPDCGSDDDLDNPHGDWRSVG